MDYKKDKTTYIAYWLKRYLSEYMTAVKDMSANTQKSYRDTFRLLLQFVGMQLRRPVDKIEMLDISESMVLSFLDEIEQKRGCTARTRNQRLAAIAGFAKYVSMHSPEYVEWCRCIRNIPLKKSAIPQITYLEKDEMNAILNGPNRSTPIGQRDYALLLFMYNTGTRADEVASLKIRDLSEQAGKTGLSIVTIIGKGRKTRRCPLWKNTGDIIHRLIGNRGGEEPVFLNKQKERLTRHGVYDIVTHYAKLAEEKFPSIAEKRVSPHTIRHTTATHLLQAGVDINTIRAWLGHVSINTTNIYAEVNLEMKVKALLTCEITDGKKSRKHWRDDESLMSFLDSI